MELRVEAAKTTEAKNFWSRWMPSHQELAHSKQEDERVDIKMDALADKLVKKGTKLPLHAAHPKEPCSIYIAGGEAPTPTNKWIH